MRALLIVAAMMSVAHADMQRDPTALVIAIDVSASMTGERLDLVKSAVLDVIDTRPAGDRVAVIAISKRSRVIATMGTNDAKRVGRALDMLVADTSATIDVAAGLELAAKQFGDPHMLHHVVLVTDSDTTMSAVHGVDKLRAAHATLSILALQTDHHVALDDLASRGKGTTLVVDDLVVLPGDLERAALAPTVHMPDSVVFVIDRSFSMRTGGLDDIKHAALDAIAQLPADDDAAIVAFDSEAVVALPLTSAREHVRIESAVSRLQYEGGTNIFTGLKAADELLRNTKHRSKRVVLYTDGDAPADGIAELCQMMREERITIDVVGIQGSDRALLAQIADEGDGRLFMLPDGMPKLFP